jgi:hypothetical protein
MLPLLVNILHSILSLILGIFLTLAYDNYPSINTKISKLKYLIIGSCLIILLVFVIIFLIEKLSAVKALYVRE